MKYYYQVWIRGVKGIFSWHFSQDLPLGTRVFVELRKKKKRGIIVKKDISPPSFKTKPLLEVLEKEYIPPYLIKVSEEMARNTISSWEKIMSLIVPEKFCLQDDPVKREIFFKKGKNFEKGGDLRGEKQKKALSCFGPQTSRLPSSILKKHASNETLKNLVQKGYLELESGRIKSSLTDLPPQQKNYNLTPAQKKAFEEIKKSDRPTLLFGITGSGKTEIYKHLAREITQKDPEAQVLFLIPEIALTHQLIADFYAIFGDLLSVWHSRLNEGEKTQEWERIRTGESRILIGTRSAVFIPLKKPALIILDEEHEWTFKNEFSPRYWTHQVVSEIGKHTAAKQLFASATPRLESFLHCEEGDWNRVDLKKRVHEVQLPHIQIIDLKNERKKGNETPFSQTLQSEIEKMVERKKQGVLFLNKRGYSGATFCQECGQNFECPHCSYNMKMHTSSLQSNDKVFICHVCGHMEKFPSQCPACRAKDFVFRGWGTQMVEKEIQKIFPQLRVLRADADSITGRYDFEKIIERFHNYEADILLGTQMIAKGLDFERVDLVGVILADVGLGLPDFRSEERVYQILTQVSGRAGRRKNQGKIILQTYHPENPLFDFVKKNETETFLQNQKEQRKVHQMPPFCRIIKILFSDPQKTKAYQKAYKVYQKYKSQKYDSLQEIFFTPAFFPRSHNKYHFYVVLRCDKKIEKNLYDSLREITSSQDATVDIDPVSLL